MRSRKQLRRPGTLITMAKLWRSTCSFTVTRCTYESWCLMVMFSYVFHQQLLSYGFFNHSSSSIFTLGGLNPSQKYVRKFQPIIKIYMVEQLYIYRNHPPQKKNSGTNHDPVFAHTNPTVSFGTETQKALFPPKYRLLNCRSSAERFVKLLAFRKRSQPR